MWLIAVDPHRGGSISLRPNTPAGRRCADKTRQALAFAQLRTQRLHLIVYTGGYFEIVKTLSVVPMVLPSAPPVQETRRVWWTEPLKPVQKRA